jgi:hypothetical protein
VGARRTECGGVGIQMEGDRAEQLYMQRRYLSVTNDR